MTIILFLVDTSASMNQRAYISGRETLIDVAKDAVERFIKIRQRDSASRGDRYMLLTFEEPPSNIKAGWKENHATFMNELKNLTAQGMTTLGNALKNAFDLLNINRMQTGIDTYGQGRCPFYLEPSIIILITDGSKLSNGQSVQEELNLPMHLALPGSELTKEPFRWDQRLFSLVLKVSGNPLQEREGMSTLTEPSSIELMSEVTGGRAYSVTSHRVLLQSLDSLVQKVQSGVVINFEKVGADPPTSEDVQEEKGASLPTQNGASNNLASPNTSWHSCRKLIYVQRNAQKGYSVGHWPLPESFWPDPNSPALAPRAAHPVVKFSCAAQDPMVIDNLPFDKYELEPSALTQYILSRKQPSVAWQVFVGNSHKNSELGHPFGYLKASTNLTCVNLFVLPYNYPVLLPLLDELFRVHNRKPTREWKQQFDAYLKTTPMYYAGPLKRALQRMGAPNLIPESMENCLNYNILNYLKRLKNQAKAEFDKLVASVGSGKSINPDGIRVNPALHVGIPTRKLSEMPLTSHPSLNERFVSIKAELNDFNGFVLALSDKEIKVQSYRNPFDISRCNLLDQIVRMRANYLRSSLGQIRFQDDDQIHSLPVGQMGNYQEYLKRVPLPLREIESAPVRQHMFGNPFKIDKRMMVDEADIDLVGGGASPQSRSSKRQIESSGLPKPKRKPGPLPKDFPIKRPFSPVLQIQSPPPSPSPPFSPLPEEAVPVQPESLPEISIVQTEKENKDIPPPEDINPFSVENGAVFSAINLEEDRKAFTNHVDTIFPKREKVESDETFPMNYNHTSEVKIDTVKIRNALFKEVRKPGRNFDQLFLQLQSVPGNLDLRVCMIRDVINEAQRFKRKRLIALLEEFAQKMVESDSFMPETFSKDFYF